MGLAVLGVLLLVAPLTSAASPPFTAVPSYVPYGGLHDVGHSVIAHVGTGSNKVLLPPMFTPTTGADQSAQQTWTSTGTFGIEVWSGIQNLSFSCPTTNCASGAHPVKVDWNASWSVRLNTSCPGNVTTHTGNAFANVSIVLMVIDSSTHLVIATTSSLIFYHHVVVAGFLTAGKTHHHYPVSVSANLVSGHAYTVRTYFWVVTEALSSPPAGALCSTGATASVGALAPTILEDVKVA